MSESEGKSGSTAKIWIRIVAGAGLAATPWLYKFTHLTGPATSAWIAGAVLIGLGLAGLRMAHPAIMWAQLATGAWLVFAPWILKFANQALPTQVHVIIGALMAGMAIRDALQSRFRSVDVVAS